jgi:tetratricopeptide (TPR) repeat protein
MPNVCMAAGVRLTVLISVAWLGSVPARGQIRYGNPYDASLGRSPFGFPGFGSRESLESLPSFPQAGPVDASEPSTVSADVLRHPLSSKARRLFEKAMHFAELGNHLAAIDGLRDALVKCPSDAPYAHNLLGLEYIEAHEYTEAKESFAEAARLMPRESSNHSNLGLSLAIMGEWDTAEKEERTALRLDKSNSKAQLILEALLVRKRNKTADAKP